MARPRIPRLTCEYCGGEFKKPQQRGPVPKFCSVAHRQRAYEENKMKRVQAEARDLRRRLKLATTAMSLSTMRAKRGHAEELHAVLEELDVDLVAA